MRDGERVKRKGGKGESEPRQNKRNQAKMPYEDKTRQMDTEMDFSLSFSFSPLSHSLLASQVNVTSLDAFHSPLAVPARRYSVKPIYITKWLFLALPPHSFLPTSPPLFPPLTTIHLSNGMHLGMDEGLHLSARTFKYISQGKEEIYYILFRMARKRVISFQL